MQTRGRQPTRAGHRCWSRPLPDYIAGHTTHAGAAEMVLEEAFGVVTGVTPWRYHARPRQGAWSPT
jgi:hypothetical protein